MALTISSLLALALAFGGATANSIHSLPVRKSIHVGPEGILKRDLARRSELHKRAEKAASGAFPISNSGILYTASIGVGSPPTQYSLQVDTGSANIWVGLNNSYVKTETSVETGENFAITYGDGSVYGYEYLDQVTLSPDLVIANQSIGVSNKTGDFAIKANVDGILGIGLTLQTNGTVTSANGTNGTIPTVTDSLLAQGTIDSEVIGIHFAPSSSPDSDGELSFGGVDDSKFDGNITYVPSSTGSWYINQDIAYGNTTFLSGSGIVDTGTIMVYMSINEFEGYLTMSGGSYNSSINLISFTPEQYAALQPLNFIIGGQTFALNANAQIWPRSMNSLIGGEEGNIYSIVSTYGNTFPFQFILGYTFLERFYSVFDATNSRIGFAYTAETNATTN